MPGLNGNFVSTSTSVATLANNAAALANQVKTNGDKATINELGKATTKIASTAGTLAGITSTLLTVAGASLTTGPGAVVGIVLVAVAGICALVGALFGSDEDEATLQEAAQVQQANTQLQLNNMLLDQKRVALQSAIDNSLPSLQQFSQNNLKGFFTNGLGAPSADAQLNTAKSENQYLKDQQVKKINNIASLIENFTNVVDSIANRNKYLFNMKQVQQYGSYASAAAALTALTLGMLKAINGDYKKGAIYGGAGLVGGALAYYLYTQSQLKSKVVAQSNAALQQYSVAVNQASAEARFPSKSELGAALLKWRAYDYDKLNSYNEQNGTLSNGDWKGQIISNNPIEIKWIKGGTETFYVKLDHLNGLKGVSNLLS